MPEKVLNQFSLFVYNSNFVGMPTRCYQGRLDISVMRLLTKAGLRYPFNTDSIKKGANRLWISLTRNYE